MKNNKFKPALMRQTKNEQFYEQIQKAQNYAIDKVEKIKSDKKLPKFSRIMDFVKWVLLWVKVYHSCFYSNTGAISSTQ